MEATKQPSKPAANEAADQDTLIIKLTDRLEELERRVGTLELAETRRTRKDAGQNPDFLSPFEAP